MIKYLSMLFLLIVGYVVNAQDLNNRRIVYCLFKEDINGTELIQNYSYIEYIDSIIYIHTKPYISIEEHYKRHFLDHNLKDSANNYVKPSYKGYHPFYVEKNNDSIFFCYLFDNNNKILKYVMGDTINTANLTMLPYTKPYGEKGLYFKDSVIILEGRKYETYVFKEIDVPNFHGQTESLFFYEKHTFVLMSKINYFYKPDGNCVIHKYVPCELQDIEYYPPSEKYIPPDER